MEEAALPPYPREQSSWSSIPLPPYLEVRAREFGASSKDEHADEGKSIRSGNLNLNLLASDSNGNEAGGEIEDEGPEAMVLSSRCTGERGDEEWRLVSNPTTLTREREDHADENVDEVSAILVPFLF